MIENIELNENLIVEELKSHVGQDELSHKAYILIKRLQQRVSILEGQVERNRKSAIFWQNEYRRKS